MLPPSTKRPAFTSLTIALVMAVGSTTNMSIKPVIFHREDCIGISFRKVRKYGVVFFGADLIDLVFQADLGDRILIHVIAADTDGYNQNT